MKRLISLLPLLLLALGSLVSVTAGANAPVEATGLFKDRAMLRVLGKDYYLRVGQSSPEGAQLLEADASHALVSFRGETYRLGLTDRVGGEFAEIQDTSISIAPDGLGQYRVGGSINGKYVDFLVDTGASVVALSERLATSLGIDYATSEQRGTVLTAQGEAQSYLVTLQEVNVGGISARDVQAAIIEGDYPIDVLLGMSYLKHVGMQENAGVLVLKRKY